MKSSNKHFYLYLEFSGTMQQTNHSFNSDLIFTLLVFFSAHFMLGQSLINGPVHKDSTLIVAWAAQCEVNRGFLNIQDTSLGFVSAGSETDACGAAGDGGILSLGDGGIATLSFETPISNGPGPDIAVFENAFNASFLELAFVEVSTDGIHFVRFNAISQTDTSIQIDAFGTIDSSQVYNLAGKYAANWGTPFDLDELRDSSNLNVDSIRYVRIIDVIGCVHPDFASRDHLGNIINDPFPTPFPSGGFDLDAVAVLDQLQQIAVDLIEYDDIKLFPNPVQKGGYIQLDSRFEIQHVKLFDLSGRMIPVEYSNNSVILKHLEAGLYFLKCNLGSHSVIKKIQILDQG